MITIQRKLWILAALAFLLVACGSATPEAADGSMDEHAGHTADEHPADRGGAPAPEPSPGEREYLQLTSAWSEVAREGCGRRLRDVFATRDLVQGALDGVDDPEGRATAETEDAKRWMAEADSALQGIRPQLEVGTCDPEVSTALDQTWQYYVKAGTAAVQAAQIAAS